MDGEQSHGEPILLDQPAPEPELDRIVQRPAIPLLIGVLLLLIIVATLGDDTDSDDENTTSISTTTTPPQAIDPTLPPQEPLGTLTFDGVDTSIEGVVAGRGPEPRFWRVDLGRGTARELRFAGVDDPIRSVRFFGVDRAIASLDGGRVALLNVGNESVDLQTVVDVGSRRFLGLDFVSDDGRSAWVSTSVRNSLLRWDLTSGEVLGRWVDLDGDIEDFPQPLGVLDSDDLAVTVGGTAYVIDDQGVRQLPRLGIPEHARGSWVLWNRCDEDLRCGELVLSRTDNDQVITIDPLSLFTDACGLIATTDLGDVGLVTRRLANAALVRIDPSGEALEPVALHLANFGCVHLQGLPGVRGTTWLSSSLLGVSVVDSSGEVSRVGLEPIGGLQAAAWSFSTQAEGS